MFLEEPIAPSSLLHFARKSRHRIPTWLGRRSRFPRRPEPDLPVECVFLEEHPDHLGQGLWAQVCGLRVAPLHPLEFEVLFLGLDFLGRVDFEDEGVLVPRLGVLLEEVLVNEEEAVDAHLFACFFEEFALQGFGGGFAGLDVAAGEVPVVGLLVFAEEDVAVSDGDAAGEEFDFFGGGAVPLGHSISPWVFGAEVHRGRWVDTMLRESMRFEWSR